METITEIIEFTNILATNYKSLLDKLDISKINDIKEKCIKDFNFLAQDVSGLLISPVAEKDLDDVREKHINIYNENYDTVKNLFGISNEKNTPRECIDIFRELSEKFLKDLNEKMFEVLIEDEEEKKTISKLTEENDKLKLEVKINKDLNDELTEKTEKLTTENEELILEVKLHKNIIKELIEKLEKLAKENEKLLKDEERDKDLPEMTIENENLLIDVGIIDKSNKKVEKHTLDDLSKKMKKITVKVPKNELEFMKNNYNLVFHYRPIQFHPDHRLLKYQEKLIWDAKKYEIFNLYLVVGSQINVCKVNNSISGTFQLYTKQSLIFKYPFLMNKIDKIFYTYFEDDGIKFYIHHSAEENKEQIKRTRDEFIVDVGEEMRKYYSPYIFNFDSTKQINPLFMYYKNE
jgi:hypothetical protein